MKRLLSTALTAILAVSALASCAPAQDRLDSAITVTSSAAQDCATWLDTRLDAIPDEVILGVGSDQSYGVDMSDFEDQGYLIRRLGDQVLLFGKTDAGLDLAVRKYAKAVETGGANDIDATYLEGKRIKKLTVAGNDIAEYTIVYDPATANENMKFAATELQRLIEKACGVLLPIADKTEGRYIAFAHSADESLKDDGYKYAVTDGNVTIEGAVARGCSNGVWRFLQHELNWKQLIYGDSYLVPADHVDIPEGAARTETPAFEYLNNYNMAWDQFNNERGAMTAAQQNYGTLVNACHGMQSYRFCDEDYAVRQICYTDEERYEECLENVERYIQNKLNAGQKIGREFKSVDISHGDNNGFCTCKTCKKIFKQEGGHAGYVVSFANRLSEELNEKYPGLLYQIFSYAGTNAPPKVTKPNEFVHITFCADGNCSNHKMDGSECTGSVISSGKNNTHFAEWLEGWCALTSNVYVWFYALDCQLQQYTVIDNIYDDFKYFHELGLEGIFWQHQNYGLGTHRVDYQLLTELNWNMDMTKEEFEALLCELLEKEYGDGWENIREYIHTWQNAQDLVDCWQCWGWTLHGCWDPRYSTAYYAETYDTSYARFEEAIHMANSKVQEGRVERLSCHMLYEGCYSSYFNEYLENDTERIAVLEERYALMLSRLRENGFDTKRIVTVDGHTVSFPETLYEEAWKTWATSSFGWFEFITGQPLPEDAPVIE